MKKRGPFKNETVLISANEIQNITEPSLQKEPYPVSPDVPDFRGQLNRDLNQPDNQSVAFNPSQQNTQKFDESVFPPQTQQNIPRHNEPVVQGQNQQNPPKFEDPISKINPKINIPEINKGFEPSKKSEFNMPKERSPWKTILGLAFILLLFGGVFLGAILYTKAWDPLWNLFREKPEDVVKQMVLKMQEVKNAHSEISFSLNIKNTEESAIFSDIKANSNFITDFDFTIKEEPKSQAIISFSSSVSNPRETFNLRLSGENRIIGENFYFKIINIDIPIFSSMVLALGVDLNKIKNQWVKIDKSSLESIGSSYGYQSAENQQQKAEKFKNIILQNLSFYVKKEFSDEKIKNTSVYHYSLFLSKENIKKIITEAQKETKSDLLSEEMEKIDEFLNQTGDLTADFWIGKKDNLLYKILFQNQIQAKKEQLGFDGSISFNLEINFSNFNEPVIIIAPEKPKTVEDLLKETFGENLPSFNTEEESEKNVKIKNDMNLISDTILNTVEVSCKGKTLAVICGRVKENSGQNPVILRNYSKYCSYVKLPDNVEGKEKYYCIDWQKNKVESDINPGQKNFCDWSTLICPVAEPKQTTPASENNKNDSSLLQASLKEIILRINKK